MLDSTESEFLAELAAPEFAPLRAWIEDFFGQLREELPDVAAAGGSANIPQTVFARYAPAAQGGGARSVRRRQESVLNRLAQFLDDLLERTEAGELTTDLCLRSLPAAGVEVRMYPPRYPDRTLAEITERTVRVVYRGLYAYQVETAAGEGFACTERSCGLLDLWLTDGPFVVCAQDAALCSLRGGALEECGLP